MQVSTGVDPYLLFIFWGCCNKLAQICWLKITKIYSFIIPEAGSPKLVMLGWNQGDSRAVPYPHPHRYSRESIPCLFQLLVAITIAWLVAASRQFLSWWPHYRLHCVCQYFFSVSLFWWYMWLHLENTKIIWYNLISRSLT